MYTGI